VKSIITMMAAHAKSALIILTQKLDPHPRRTAIAMPTFMETPKTARDALLVLMVARLLNRLPPLLLHASSVVFLPMNLTVPLTM
jgi:hypothetical protein